MEAFQLRLWDGRIGRWLSQDPYGQYASPYLGMGNNPIGMTDPDGGYSWFGAAWRYAAGGFEGDFHKSTHEGWGWGITGENTPSADGIGFVYHQDFGQNRGDSNIFSGIGHTASDLWNSPSVRAMVPDRLYFSLSYNANPYVGTSTDFSLNWITRGNDASFIPYSITTVAGTAGMANGGVGIGVGGGYFPTTDMRSLPTGIASNAMLGWSYIGTAFGAADGGRVSLTGSVGIKGTPLNPKGVSWITGGASVGFGTPGAGFYGGVSHSTPSFGTKKEF